MRRAVYGGSFDPVTNGHLWIIEEAAKLFDSLVVAIGENFEKAYTFSLEDRLECLSEVTKKFPNIKVTHFKNDFLVNYAKSIDAQYIVRGIRNPSDYEYERSMRHINSDLNKEISTVFLLPPRAYAEVSSSMVKGLVGSTGWENIVKKYVPHAVFDRLYTHHHKQKKL
ncbi:MAG: pantetheine-phosphate adenylyltransferase [Proteobacteria bacterium]|jgi:pantetheine-phosphate adenylyltransferase|nr:pantetheine-phosphate adenylyltransferase [Pseudomonadota bacterium]